MIVKHTFNATLLLARQLQLGLVHKNNVPISCPVYAYSRQDGTLLSKTKSSSDGRYILFGSGPSRTFVVAIDPANELNLVGQTY